MNEKAVSGCRLIMPNGSLEQASHQLMADAGMPVVRGSSRSYEERVVNESLFPPPYDKVRLMRPQDIPWVIAEGHAELGFTGNDLIGESAAANNNSDNIILGVFRLSGAGSGGTSLVLAVPEESSITELDQLNEDHVLVTEYPNYVRSLDKRRNQSPKIHSKIQRCHGSAESFKGIADAIVDVSETGTSLRENGWRVIATLLKKSRLCLITNTATSESVQHRLIIDSICLLLDSAIAARERRLLKCNVSDACLDTVLSRLPAADRPTVSPLAGNSGHAVEAVVLTSEIPKLIVDLKAAGATDIFDQPIGHFVP